MNSAICYIGLGSNLDQPLLQLQNACRALSRIESSSLEGVSSIYQSKPMGPQNQPDFLNAVAKLCTDLAPQQLLKELQSIENQQLRQRGEHWGPRTIDLDLLLYDSITLKTDTLTVPHPGIAKRDFVMVPLEELQPDLTLPNGKHVSDALTQLPAHGLAKFASPEVLLEACS